MEDLKQKEQNKTLPAPGGAEKQKTEISKALDGPGQKGKKQAPEDAKMNVLVSRKESSKTGCNYFRN